MANGSAVATQELRQYAQYPDLPGRKVLVTGSSSGIGKAVALAFASQLSNGQSSRNCICVTSRSSSRLQLVANELQKLGAEAFAVTGDLTVVENCTNIVNKAAELMGGLDILVNSGATFTEAGAANHGNCSEIDFQESYKIHVASTVAMTQAAIPYLQKSKGAVVNISSIASEVNMPAQIAYCTAKAMQDSVTRNYAMRYAKEGIRVNSVNPGYTLTDVFDTLAEENGMSRAAFEASTAVKHPMGRNATPQDIAAAVLFLSSQSASFITGAILSVSGGMTLTSWLNLEDQPQVALWLVWKSTPDKENLAVPLTVFGISLALGNWWNVIFMGRHQLKPSLKWMGAFWLSIAGTIATFQPVSPLAALLVAPTQLWVTIAAKLNYDIVKLNGQAADGTSKGW